VRVTTDIDLFKAIDGVRLMYSRLGLVLRAPGVYSNGRGALSCEELETGQPYAVLTVNMPEEELGPDELLIRTGNGGRTDVAQVRAAVLATGLFEPVGRFADSGHVQDYAVVWRFRRCTHGPYVALCRTRLAEIDKRYADAIEKLMAKAAAKRLGEGIFPGRTRR
jgi:hypothetical protein